MQLKKLKISKRVECGFAIFSTVIGILVFVLTISRQWYESLIYASMSYVIIAAFLGVHYRVIIYILRGLKENR